MGERTRSQSESGIARLQGTKSALASSGFSTLVLQHHLELQKKLVGDFHSMCLREGDMHTHLSLGGPWSLLHSACVSSLLTELTLITTMAEGLWLSFARAPHSIQITKQMCLHSAQ